MTRIYLAYSTSGEFRYTREELARRGRQLNMLCAFSYLDRFDPAIAAHKMLDSGAFSVWKSGVTIDIAALIDESKKPLWDESVTLDVIGDADASHANALRMKAAGSPAFPVFHIGEPWDLFAEYCAEFPKVGLSCRFGETVSMSQHFITQCFARGWPHLFHSFGWITDWALENFPFDSADTASWNSGPAAWGRWKPYGKMSVRGGQKSLLPQIDHYQELERRALWQWNQTLQPIRRSAISAKPVSRSRGSTSCGARGRRRSSRTRATK